MSRTMDFEKLARDNLLSKACQLAHGKSYNFNAT
jgi:hypothetical protein